MDTFIIEKASISDHTKLTAITLEGKAFWRYSADQLSLWTNELTITPKYIEELEIYKLILDSQIIGYYSFVKINKSEIKLDNLFLSAIYIGKGFGKILMVDFLKRMKNSKIENIFLEADPNAESFYKKFGFITFDHQQSSIKGRFIPLMKLQL